MIMLSGKTETCIGNCLLIGLLARLVILTCIPFQLGMPCGRTSLTVRALPGRRSRPENKSELARRAAMKGALSEPKHSGQCRSSLGGQSERGLQQDNRCSVLGKQCFWINKWEILLNR